MLIAVGRYIVKGPYIVPTLPLDDLVVAILGGGSNVGQVKREPQPLTLKDLAKPKNDDTAFTEFVYCVPPDLFDHITLCQFAHEVGKAL